MKKFKDRFLDGFELLMYCVGECKILHPLIVIFILSVLGYVVVSLFL